MSKTVTMQFLLYIKRIKEGQTMEETISKKIIWKSSFDDPHGGVVEVTSDMGCFAGANQNYVSILKRTLDEEREKNIMLQNEK